ncbi:hypothetical protein ACIO13_34755 [Streptomyces sp. NPDC087425]|uniref:hypothetical protein n=1 Tax=Streptomyces sp. NPDC087425 TaxID=3365787 RepID=UPI00382B6621
MTNARGRWTGGTLTAKSLLKPHQVARAVFHPAWIPESVDPTVERLKRIRVVAGAFAALGVYTYVEGGFSFDEIVGNAATASVVLFLLTPLTVGVMLWVWRRSGTVGQLRGPLSDAFKLLALFVGSVLVTYLLLRWSDVFGALPGFLLKFVVLWLVVFVVAGAVRLTGNFFGTAAVHRGLPALLAMVTTWLMALPDLLTGDLHGLSLTMGVIFILGAPVTVTGIALLELRRLRSRYGIRLAAHPATLPRLIPAPPSSIPGHGPVPPQGNPYAHPHGNPYSAPHLPWPPQPGNRHNRGAR